MREFRRKRFGGNFGSGRFGGERRFARPSFGYETEKPVKVGEEHRVIINEISRKGDGIARIKNFVIFIPETDKGQEVVIRIKQVKERYGIGEVVERLKMSKEESVEEIEAIEGSGAA